MSIEEEKPLSSLGSMYVWSGLDLQRRPISHKPCCQDFESILQAPNASNATLPQLPKRTHKPWTKKPTPLKANYLNEGPPSVMLILCCGTEFDRYAWDVGKMGLAESFLTIGRILYAHTAGHRDMKSVDVRCFGCSPVSGLRNGRMRQLQAA